MPPTTPPPPGALTFAPAGRARPPRHLADLTPHQRREAVTGLGERGFRADQLSRHYFTHLADDPSTMTDLPTGSRSRLAAELLHPC
jgi:23S rRNA (adenine2503-C2)-methyltransferase